MEPRLHTNTLIYKLVTHIKPEPQSITYFTNYLQTSINSEYQWNCIVHLSIKKNNTQSCLKQVGV